jgi:hypothetical protein
MSVLSVPDLVVYQALVNVIADRSSQYLVTHENQHIYGNIYSGSGKRWMLRKWAIQYAQYVRKVESLYSAGNTWIASTDIVAFYDTIDHQRLIEIDKRHCGDDDKFLELLRECLSTWSAHNTAQAMSRGIPQGSNASDYLANLFLYDIDREMIVQGYNYLRYVDDVRILAAEKSVVQRGLILFDLELKRAGLVAQVSKTSIHEISDIKREIYRLQFAVTSITEKGGIATTAVAYEPSSEQAATIGNYVRKTLSENEGANQPEDEIQDVDDDDLGEINQLQKIKLFIGDWNQELLLRLRESLSNLDDPQLSKESESNIVYCLNRLEPLPEIKEIVVKLLPRMPWKSESITRYLGLYKDDDYIDEQLYQFIVSHDVYSWHRANCLWALKNVSGAKRTVSLCREWLSDIRVDWYARTIAARIMREIPDQHAFLVECLKREQDIAKQAPEETSILRAEIAFSAFMRLRSFRKQLTVLSIVCNDQSPLVNRLVIFLLQQPYCKVKWEDLYPSFPGLSIYSELVKALDISSTTEGPCFLVQTLESMYDVKLARNHLKVIYNGHYDKANRYLRESVRAFHQNPSKFVSEFHQFAHLTLIAFYESCLPQEEEVYEGYARLTDRAIMRSILPKGIETWKRLGSLRNRGEHPVDRKTKTHTKPISVKEVEDLHKELKVSLQELFDFWIDNASTAKLDGTLLDN